MCIFSWFRSFNVLSQLIKTDYMHYSMQRNIQTLFSSTVRRVWWLCILYIIRNVLLSETSYCKNGLGQYLYWYFSCLKSDWTWQLTPLICWWLRTKTFFSNKENNICSTCIRTLIHLLKLVHFNTSISIMLYGQLIHKVEISLSRTSIKNKTFGRSVSHLSSWNFFMFQFPTIRLF